MLNKEIVLDHFIYGNVFIALCASSLCYFNVLLLGLNVNATIYILVFSLTHTTYSFQRLFGNYKKDFTLSSSIDKWVINNYRISLFTSLISLVASCYLLFSEYKSSIWVLSITSIIAALYVIPLKGKVPLREIGFLKSILIGAIWSVIVCLFPYLNSTSASLDLNSLLIVTFANLFFITAQTIPFDIRDIQFDRQINIRTLPQMVGVQKSKKIAQVCVIISIACIIFYSINLNSLYYSFCWIASCLYLMVLIENSEQKKKDFYYSILLESVIMTPLILAIFKEIN